MSDTAMISVPEITPTGTEIGDPFAATDDDVGATLEYSLGGDDECIVRNRRSLRPADDGG